jgi:hypothetical protein
LPQQGAFRFGVSRIELPHLGIEQIVKEQGGAFSTLFEQHIRIKTAPPLRVSRETNVQPISCA